MGVHRESKSFSRFFCRVKRRDDQVRDNTSVNRNMLHHYSDHVIMLDQKFEVRCKRAVQSKVMCSHESQHVEDGMKGQWKSMSSRSVKVSEGRDQEVPGGLG